MDNTNFYVPILKWKRGEQKAVEFLDDTSKNYIMPLLEIAPIDFDWNNNIPKKTIDEHVISIPNTIFSSLKSHTCFVDGLMLEDENVLANGTHSIEYLIEKSLDLGCNVIPVTGFCRSVEYNNGIKNLLNNNKLDTICIRIEETSFDSINTNIESLLNSLEISPKKCHIIIDLKEIGPTSLSTYNLVLPLIINNLNYLTEWISITIAGTSFPVDLSSVSKNSYKILPRSEYSLWKQLIDRTAFSRDVQFGDYCISNPQYSDVDPRFMNMSGNIRYTITNGYLIYKGVTTRLNGFAQMIPMSLNLISSGYFSGIGFSWGDNEIDKIANGLSNTGNGETWRRIGLSLIHI